MGYFPRFPRTGHTETAQSWTVFSLLEMGAVGRGEEPSHRNLSSQLFRNLKLEEPKFEACLSNLVRPCLRVKSRKRAGNVARLLS